jgi:hypothetical protein
VCSMETNDMVQVQESGLSEERHPAPGKSLHLGEPQDMVEVQEGGLSEESQLALGKSLRLGETNRTAQEGP